MCVYDLPPCNRGIEASAKIVGGVPREFLVLQDCAPVFVFLYCSAFSVPQIKLIRKSVFSLSGSSFIASWCAARISHVPLLRQSASKSSNCLAFSMLFLASSLLASFNACSKRMPWHLGHVYSPTSFRRLCVIYRLPLKVSPHSLHLNG
mgnify:CR=1 FL=1